MVILGLLLAAAGILVVVACLTTAQLVGGHLEVLGVQVNAVTLFLLGLGAGLAIVWGWAIFRAGTRRAMKQRRERRKLEELSTKLDRVEAERRRDPDDDRDPHD